MIALAAAALTLSVGTPVTPPGSTGRDGEGRVVASLALPRDGRREVLALFERSDIPVYPPGTVADCFAYGNDLSDVPISQHFGMTCTPRDPDALMVNVFHRDPRAGRLSPARYKALRRARRPLPGTTIVAGRAGSATKRITVRWPGGRRTIRVERTEGGFVAAWPQWLENAEVRVGRTGFQIGRAALKVVAPGAGPQVLPPRVEPRP